MQKEEADIAMHIQVNFNALRQGRWHLYFLVFV